MVRIRTFNDSEFKELLKNPNIKGIKNKSQIIYRNEFKLWAVLQKFQYPEKTAREIFVSAGFDMNILDDRTPQRRLSSWVKKYQIFGSEYFIQNNKYRYNAIDIADKNNEQNSQIKENNILLETIKLNNLLTYKLIKMIETLKVRHNEKNDN